MVDFGKMLADKRAREAALLIPEEREFLVTSHSIDGTFESCPRRFEFRHVIGMVPDVDESGFAADAGTAMHEALQEYCRSKDLNAAFWTLCLWWPWRMEQAKERRDARNFDQATLLLQALIDHEFWDEWEVATLPDGSYAIELAFRIEHVSLGSFIHPRTGKPTFLATQGRIDFIVRHKVTGELRILDLKTTTYDESVHDAAYRFSGQAGSYGMVLSHATGHDFHKHGLKVSYMLAEFSPTGPVVRIYDYHLSPEEVEDSIRTKTARLESMLKQAREGFWHRRQHGCAFYSTPCGYLDVCHRRDMRFLLDWFAAESDRFKLSSRIYEPYWTLEA